MRVVREEPTFKSNGYETIFGRLKTGKKYAIRLAQHELLVYLGEGFELTKQEMRELEYVCNILEGI